MFEFLARIPGLHFLLILAVVALALTVWGCLAYFRRKDEELPQVHELSAETIAYLRGGWRGVVRAVLYRLHERQLISTGQEEEGMDLRASGELPEDADLVERALLSRLGEPARCSSLLSDDSLKQEVENALSEERSKLEKASLLRTQAQERIASTSFEVLAVALVLLGGIKLLFGLQSDKPVLLLVILVAGILHLLHRILGPGRPSTLLGLRYLRRLEAHFRWLRADGVPDWEHRGVDPALLVAVFGAGVLAVAPAIRSSATLEGGLFLSGVDWDGGGVMEDGDGDGGCDGGCGGCGGCG